MTLSQKKNENLVFVALSIFLIVYFWIRGHYVPITFDEAATFFHFVHRGEFWYFNSIPDANNHLLNSILSYITYSIFGSSKLALRIPNLLSLIIYLYFLYKLSQLIETKFLRWILILSLMFAHFFMEFFALTRGYGLSMAFLLATFYYLIKFSSEKVTTNIIWISVFLFLAELSNLSVLVLVIAIIGYELLIIATSKLSKKLVVKQVIIIVLTQIIPLVLSSFYMFYLNQKGSLYYGDSSGFWNLTVQSLILFITGSKSIYYSIAVIFLFTFLIFAVGYSIKLSGLKAILDPKLALALLLFATITGVILLSEIFGINHPEDRVAMYLIPLFLGSLVMVANFIFIRTNKFVNVFPIVLLLFFPIHFIYSMNLNYVNGYKTEVLPESFYTKIINDTDFNDDTPPTIGGYRMRSFCWVYQNYENGGSQNLIDYVSYPENQSDFQIVDIDENPEWLDYYDIIDTEPVLGRKLLKRKQPLSLKLSDRQSASSKDDIINEYFRLATWKADSLKAESYYLIANIDIVSPYSPFQAWFVLQFNDESGSTLSYKYIPLDWLKDKWNNENMSFNHSMLTGALPQNLDLIKVYIWNLDKIEYSIKNSEITLFEIE